MIQCRCGGLITIGELVNSRERWHCQACGRYEIFDLMKQQTTAYLFGDQKAHAQVDSTDKPYLF